jgi:protein TonB
VLCCALVASIGFTWYSTRHAQYVAPAASTFIEPELPAAKYALGASDPVKPQTAAAPRLLQGGPAAPARQSPEQAGVESVSPHIAEPDTPASDASVATIDSGEPKPPLESTPAILVDAPPVIGLSQGADASPQTDTFTAPVRLKTIAPDYPVVARAGQIEGDVVLQASVDTGGHVTAVTVMRSVHPLLDEAARQAVLQYEYAPGRRNGVAESSTVRIVVSFRLR